MGSISSYARCERFVEEFNGDAVKMYGPKAPWIETSGLGIRGDEGVYLYMRLRMPDGTPLEVLVSDAPLFFDPYEDHDDVSSRVVDVLQLSEEEAKKRLKEAGLISE